MRDENTEGVAWKLLLHGLEEYEEFNWCGHWERVLGVRRPTLTEQALAE